MCFCRFTGSAMAGSWFVRYQLVPFEWWESLSSGVAAFKGSENRRAAAVRRTPTKVLTLFFKIKMRPLFPIDGGIRKGISLDTLALVYWSRFVNELLIREMLTRD